MHNLIRAFLVAIAVTTVSELLIRDLDAVLTNEERARVAAAESAGHLSALSLALPDWKDPPLDE